MNKTLARTIGEGTFWISVSTFALKGVSLATVFLMLSRLGAAQYGVLELVLSIISLFSIFMLPGLDTLIVADMGSEKGKGKLSRARKILFAYSALQYMLAGVACVAVILFASALARFYQVPVLFVRVLCLFFLVSPLRSAYGVLFRVDLDFFRLSLLSFLEEVFKFALLLGFFFYFQMYAGGVLAAMLGAQLLALLILTPAFIRKYWALTGGSEERIPWRSSLMGRGMWSVLTTYAGNVGKTARLWIIQRLLGHEAVGLYAVAIGLIGHTMALAPLYSVVAPLLPQYAHDRIRFTKLLNKAMKYQFLAYLAIGIVGFFVFPPVLQRLFPQYAGALPLFQVMIFGLIPTAFISVVTPAYFALKLQKSFFFSMVFKTVVSVAFTYGLVAGFGFFGLAYEYILTSLVYGIERLRTLRKHVPGISISRTYLFSFDDDDRFLLGKSLGTLQRFVDLPWRGRIKS